MKRLTSDEWAVIRAIWEYSPDRPSHGMSASMAAERHSFAPPSKQAVQRRAKAEGWERKASLAGVNQAAHRIADRMADTSDDNVVDNVVGSSAKKETSEFSESSNKRAQIRARHRQEWTQVAGLRQEALSRRHTDPDDAFRRLKVAKITAEITQIQQNGESKAWGMDEILDPAKIREMSDEALEKIARGLG